MKMNHAPLLIYRRILQAAEIENTSETNESLSSAAAVAGDPSFQSGNGSAAAIRNPFTSSTHFDSSMALTILVLLTALFFMGFFSVYIRRFAAAEDPSPPTSASGSRRRPSPNRKGGLDPSAVGSLPLVAYGRAAKHRMIDDCPICLSEFQERETVKLIPYCGHVFHAGCVDTWLASHVTCPLCRSAQLFIKGADDEGVIGCHAAQV